MKKILLKFKSLKKLGYSNEAYVILNSLPKSYKKMKSALKYDGVLVTIDSKISILKAKEIELQSS